MLLRSDHDQQLRFTGASVPGITAVPHEDNLRYFDVTVDVCGL